jgi:hypothetical protein
MRPALALAVLYGVLALLVAASQTPRAAFTDPVGCSQLPALTGDTTTSAGSCATTTVVHLIASTTVTASSTGIQFTSLPSGYNTLRLNCNGLTLSSTSNTFLVQIGEGVTPTWETGAHYSYQVWFSAASTTVSAIKGTTGTDFTTGLGVVSTTIPTSIKLTLDNYTSTTLNKMVIWFSTLTAATSGIGFQMGTGYWNNDANAVTGLQVVPSAGTMSGTCTLFAYN